MKLKPSLYPAILLLAVLAIQLLPGCAPSPERSRLEQIETIIDEHPDSAMTLLDSVDATMLSEADRHYFDFLTIKARDKAYIRHTSDSLILDVMDYYSSHNREQMLPWALYYGGRVHSDLGDYPSAIRYFQDALDFLPPDSKEGNLRASTLSQIGQLLCDLCLYEQAIPYIQKSIKQDSINTDSLNMMLDTDLLAAANLNLKNYTEAERGFRIAKKIAERISPQDVHRENMFLATIKYHIHDYDSALILIRHVPDKIHPLDRSTALAHAARIYNKTGHQDTALMYAGEIISNKNSDNFRTAYRILFSSKTIRNMPEDSLFKYIHDFDTRIEKFLNKFSEKSTVQQNALYNYQLHERQRRRAEKSRDNFQTWLYLSLFFITLLTAIILYLKKRNQNSLIRLNEALDRLRAVRETLDDNDFKDNNPSHSAESNKLLERHLKISEKYEKEKVAELLRKECLELQELGKLKNSFLTDISSSDINRQIQDRIKHEKAISDQSDLWADLENLVNDNSNEFKYRLLLLAGGAISPSEFHLALLIKCGFTPSQVAILSGKSKATISYRRKNLCMRFFKQKLSTEAFDEIIRSL